VDKCDLHLLKKKINKRMEANMKKLEYSVRDCEQEGEGDGEGENDS
jgi:hypothetical protein